ncbi:MAG TPA: MarR family transcriptional regulator [Candidatus Saccharimonadales bacterium]|nr:MarR family transcriptional regulator [Candidatus Saccharimonadales bacterium]
MKTQSPTSIQEEIINLAYQIARQMRKQFSSHLDAKLHEKISSYQIHALYTLTQRSATMGELAEEMNISLPSATALVDRLVRSGWVERQPDPTDRRIIRLTITEHGGKLCEAMQLQRSKGFKFLLDAMPPADVAALHRIFTNLHETLEAKKNETAKPKEGIR